MTTSYDGPFVIASVLVAMLASFTALDLGGRVRSESGAMRLGWIAAGGVVMGVGIWSMHFIGMLAFHLPVPIWYDVPLMLLSMGVAIAASLLALVVITRPRLGPRTVIPGALLMGGAIAGMHYIGMASMRMDATVSYSTPIVGLSVLIAIVASLAALWLAVRFRSDFTLRGTLLKILGGIALGGAISGMHYAGMAAAQFVPAQSLARHGHYLTASGRLGEAVVIGTILIVVLALSAAAIDRSIQSESAFTKRLGEEQSKLSKSEQQYRLLFENNPNPMWVYVESTWAFLAVNDAAVRQYGYTREEFLGMTRHDIRVGSTIELDEIKIPDGRQRMNRFWSGRHRRKDGTVIDVEISSQSIAFDGHDACLALALDVTDRKRAEESSRYNERRTRLIFDTALDAVISTLASGEITDWSAQAERMFGWSRAEAVGRQMAETIIPARHRDAHNRILKRFLDTGEGPVLNKRMEIIGLARDGREFPIEMAISPARLGDEWTFSAFIRDLTESTKAAEALKLGEQRYRELFEGIPVGLYRSTPDGILIDVNPAMVAMLGYPSRESLLATAAAALYVDPADQFRWSTEMRGEGAVLDFDVQMRRADGVAIWTRDTAFVKRNPDGTALRYEGILENITARVEAERALQANERRLVQILEAVPIGIFVSNETGMPVFANAASKKILGAGIADVRSASELPEVYQIYRVGTQDLYPVERLPIMRALTGEVVTVDDMELHLDTGVVSVNAHGAPIVDNDGKVVAAVVAFIDTTERKTLESQRRQTSKMEAVGQLAGGVAHDFNNLLTVIMSYGAMLLDHLEAGDPNREDVQEIAAAADRAAGLTRQLLTFSRQQVMQPRVISINTVVADLENMLRRLIGEDIELRIFLDHDVYTINADPGQLEQVLINLVVNARDAMPAGGRISIRTSSAELSPDSAGGALHPPSGDFVMLAVSDTGTGMTREVQQRLFEPFFTTKKLGRGTGLGLSTVYGIVKQSGGEVHVYSEIGQGSSFKVFFPRVAASVEEQQPVQAPKEVPLGTETLLVVEDDTSLRGLVERVLKNCGYTVYAADGGAEALAIARNPELSIDAVITDVVMPGMNGRELVERLVKSRPDLGSLLMSGYTDDDVLRRGVLKGETAFLQKPFTPEQLARKVRAVLDRVA
jgi:two-component system cell cycle sensor histidine kinase/response regulator CckA